MNSSVRGALTRFYRSPESSESSATVFCRRLYHEVQMNSVQSLIERRFMSRTLEEQLEVKRLGRPTPDLDLEQASRHKDRVFLRKFDQKLYQTCRYLCGCPIRNTLFCFPCLLFDSEDVLGSSGLSDLAHLNDRLRRHEGSYRHVMNEARWCLFGLEITKIVTDPDSVKNHNEIVKKNRYAITKMIDIIKFCSKFQTVHLADELFDNQVYFYSASDYRFKEVIESEAFTSKTDLIKFLKISIFNVIRLEIIKELQETQFFSIIFEDVSYSRDLLEIAIFFRYEKYGKQMTRFWGTHKLSSPSEIYNILVTEIRPVLDNDFESKFIAYSFDGSDVFVKCQESLKFRMQKTFPNVQFTHCGRHDLKKIIVQAVSTKSRVRHFFARLQEIINFFQNPTIRIQNANNILNNPSEMAFSINSIDEVYSNQQNLIQYMEKVIRNSKDSYLAVQAERIKESLGDKNFKFWLCFFQKILEQVDSLGSNLPKFKETYQVSKALEILEMGIIRVKSELYHFFEEVIEKEEVLEGKKRKIGENCENAAFSLEICDTVIGVLKERLTFRGPLLALSLLQSSRLGEIPPGLLKETTDPYPFLDKNRLKNELHVLYSRREFENLNDPVQVFNFVLKVDLEPVLKETSRLLRILLASPWLCRSTDSNWKIQEELISHPQHEDTLVMILTEQDIVADINFYNQVVEDFAQLTKNENFIFQETLEP